MRKNTTRRVKSLAGFFVLGLLAIFAASLIHGSLDLFTLIVYRVTSLLLLLLQHQEIVKTNEHPFDVHVDTEKCTNMHLAFSNGVYSTFQHPHLLSKRERECGLDDSDSDMDRVPEIWVWAAPNVEKGIFFFSS